MVSILPQKYFVEQVGGKHVNVSTMVGKGNDPHSYEPKPSQLVKLNQAKLYFSLGTGEFEKLWLRKFKKAAKQLKVIQTDHGIKKLKMEAHHQEEEHEGIDPHIWLSPAAVKLQATHIYNALAAEMPAHKKAFNKNYRAFLSKIDTLSSDLKALFEKKKKPITFLTLHPSWGYFADYFNLEQLTVEVEGKKPKPAQLQAIIQIAKEKNINTLFTQPQFSSRQARILANEIDGNVIAIDPLEEQWEINLRAVAHHIYQSVR